MQQLHAVALRKLTCGAPRIHTHSMQVLVLEGQDAGLIFRISSVNQDLSLNMWTVQSIAAHEPPTSYALQALESELNATHKRVDPATMGYIFPDWGESQLDKWAIECNSSYTFVFSLYYDIAAMNTRQVIKVYGKPNIDLPTYVDKYNQAQTMYKLESNL
jgi:hypothetical protein